MRSFSDGLQKFKFRRFLFSHLNFNLGQNNHQMDHCAFLKEDTNAIVFIKSGLSLKHNLQNKVWNAAAVKVIFIHIFDCTN